MEVVEVPVVASGRPLGGRGVAWRLREKVDAYLQAQGLAKQGICLSEVGKLGSKLGSWDQIGPWDQIVTKPRVVDSA